MTDDLTDLPADEGELPLDHPSNIGGPVLVDFETGEVHDLPPAAALAGAYSPPPGYGGEHDEQDPPMFAGLLSTWQAPDVAEEIPPPPTAQQGD